jgi:integrase
MERQPQTPRLLDQVRSVLRLHHYSIHTERSYNAVRAERKVNVPVVLTREEVSRVIVVMEGVPQLIVKLLYGSGLRILEAVRLRVKDVDFGMKQVTVRSGKGDKDRFTTLPATLIPLLENHLPKGSQRGQLMRLSCSYPILLYRPPGQKANVMICNAQYDILIN